MLDDNLTGNDAGSNSTVFQNRKLTWAKRLGVLLFCISCLCIVYWPIVSGTSIFKVVWTSGSHLPAFAFIRTSLITYHQLPLWIPNVMSGFPIYITHGMGFNQPLSLLLAAAIPDYITAFNVAILCYLLAGILLTMLLARSLGLSVGASIIASFTYAFSQFITSWSHGDTWADSWFFPPLFFFLILKIHKRRYALRYTLLGACSFALALVAGLIDVAAYAMITGLALAIFLDISSQKDVLWHSFSRWHTTARFFVISAIGGLIATPNFLAALSFIPYTFREHGTSYIGAGWDTGISLKEIPLLLYPQFFPRLPYLSVRVWVYVGTVSLALGLWGLYCSNKHPFGKILRWTLLGALATMVPYSPLYWLIKHLPPLNILNGSWKFMPIPILLFGIFAGIGFDSLRNGLHRDKFRIYAHIWSWGAGLIIAGSLALNVIWHSGLIRMLENSIVQFLLASRGGIKSAGHYHEIFRYYSGKLSENLSLANPQFIVALAFLAATAILLVLWNRNAFKAKVLAGITFALVVSNFLLVWQDGKLYVARDVHDMPPTISAIKAIESDNPKEPYRISLAMPDKELVYEGEDPTAEENYRRLKLTMALGSWVTAAAFHVDTIDGTDPFVTRRYDRILRHISPIDYRLDRPEFRSLSVEERTKETAGRINVLSMMNAKYLITSYDFPEPWKKISESTVSDVTLNVYENPLVLPRAYFPDGVTYLTVDDIGNFPPLLQNPDFRKNSFIECLPACPENIGTQYAGDTEARITSKTPQSMQIAVNTPVARWLVVSESHLPYWQTKIDGQDTTVYTANYLYRGIVIPPGEHTVDFIFPNEFQQARYALRDLVKKPIPYSPSFNP